MSAQKKIGKPQEEQLRRCVISVYEKELEKEMMKRAKKGEDWTLSAREQRSLVSRSYAICVKSLQRTGFLKPGTRTPTEKGRKRSAEMRAEEGEAERMAAFEQMLARARAPKVDLEALVEEAMPKKVVGGQSLSLFDLEAELGLVKSRSQKSSKGRVAKVFDLEAELFKKSGSRSVQRFSLDAAIRQLGRKRGSRSKSSKVSISKKSDDEVRALLQPIRTAMDEVFSCSTAFGDCKRQRPSAGHCILSAMIVQDLFGGEILEGRVNGIPHYWNRVGGREIDLTGDQFGKPKIQVEKGTINGGGVVFSRKPGEQLNQSFNREVCEKHDAFVLALREVFGSSGLSQYLDQLGRCILEGAS
jgi:hypothetical protein